MSMFLRYNRVDETDGKEAVQKLSEYLDGNSKKSDTKVTHGAFKSRFSYEHGLAWFSTN